MALVRKFQEAGKIDSDKKVLTYLNVGNYDAEKLASSLTRDIENYVSSLDIGGKDKLDFLNYGAQMIQAIRDGNVTKNADGSFSIKGNYGLNNRYSQLDIAELYADGKVGYGAKQYLGTYLKSHGIFTTDETRDFRHRNHILGLVGLWVNKELRTLSVIEDEPPVKEEEKSKFNFKDFFVRQTLGGNEALLNNWKALINTLEGRNAALLKAINNLTQEDYEAWALENPNLGSAADLQDMMGPLKKALSEGDSTKAQELALNLGLSIGEYLNIGQSQNAGQQVDDKYITLARLTLIGLNGLGNPSEEQVEQYADFLRRQGLNQVEKAIEDSLNNLAGAAWLKEIATMKENIEDHTMEFDPLVNDHVIDPDKDQVAVFLNDMLNMNSYIDELGPNMDPTLQIQFGEILDYLGDTYKAIKNGEVKYPDGFEDAWYLKINEGVYKDSVILRWLLTDKYSIIYNPVKDKFYRVPNLLLPETEQFTLLKEAFERQFKLDNRPTKEVPEAKVGGVLKYAIGGEISSKDATNLNWDSKKKSKTNLPDFSQIQKDYGIGLDHYEPEGTSNRRPPVRVREIHGFGDFEAEDWWRLGSLALDLSSLGASYTGVGSTGSALIGFGSTVANTIADHYDENVTPKEAVLGFIIGTSADLTSLIPFSRAAQAGRRVTNTLQKLSPAAQWIAFTLSGLLGVEYGDEFMEAWNKIGSGEGITSNDLTVLTEGLRIFIGAAAGFRNASRINRHANNMLTVGTKIKGVDGNWYPITDENLARLKLASDLKEANSLFLLATGAKVELPTTTTTTKSGKGKKAKEVTTIKPNIEVRPYKEVPEVYYEEHNGYQRETRPASVDRKAMNTGKIPKITDWFDDTQSKFGRFVNRARGYKLAPFTEVPSSAKVISETQFEYNGKTWTKGSDGKYHVETPTIEDHAPKVKLPEKKAASKRLGGSFNFARNLSIKLANGGFVPKMGEGGWFVVTDNDGKKHYFNNLTGANWYRQQNNINTEATESKNGDEYDYDWDLSNIYEEWKNSDYRKGNDGIPFNASLGQTAQELEADSSKGGYQLFTQWVRDSLQKKNGNNAYNAVIDYLQKMRNYKDALNYFNENGTLISNADALLQKYYYDHVRGYHHHKGLLKGNETLYYLNGKLVTEKDIANAKLDKEFLQSSLDKRTTHKFYVTGDDNTSDGGSNTDIENLDPALNGQNDNIEPDLHLNWGNLSEAGRVLWLNAQNTRAAELAMDWLPALAGYLHRNEILEGDYEALKNAEQGQATLNSKAGLTFSTDASLQLAAQLLATDQGNQLSQKAAQADSNKFYETRHRILNLLNDDMVYNRKVADQNRAVIADKDHDDANTKANLTMENATNLSNLWAGISKQIMDSYDRRDQQMLNYEMKRSANRQAIAASEYNARKAALDTSDKDYATKLLELGRDYMEDLDRANRQELRRTGRLLGPNVLFRSYYAKKGRKLTANQLYILSGSKDFNKRKLSEAKEFYRNIRENQKRRKS